MLLHAHTTSRINGEVLPFQRLDPWTVRTRFVVLHFEPAGGQHGASRRESRLVVVLGTLCDTRRNTNNVPGVLR
jgi:hypothetical protein